MSDTTYYGGEVEYDPDLEAVVHYAPAKDFFRWFDDFKAPYEPLMAELKAVFGTEFSMWHTGGGCMAITAVFEGGLGVMITSADDVLERFENHRHGYAVGVYPLDEGAPDTSEELLGWASSPEATSTLRLVTLITMALAQAARGDHDGGWNHIDPSVFDNNE